jgi:hypothetical protein
MVDEELMILLDFDGVMITTPPWKKLEIADDGFIKFNDNAANSLTKILSETDASIILTTTHRIRFSDNQWANIFAKRGLIPRSITILNNISTIAEMKNRAIEISEWVAANDPNINYVIIDDDKILNSLPAEIKARWIKTDSMTGLDVSCADQVIALAKILQKNKSHLQ